MHSVIIVLRSVYKAALSTHLSTFIIILSNMQIAIHANCLDTHVL